jgi:hypothetical protein
MGIFQKYQTAGEHGHTQTHGWDKYRVCFSCSNNKKWHPKKKQKTLPFSLSFLYLKDYHNS